MSSFVVNKFRIRSLSSSTVLSYRRAVGRFVDWLLANNFGFSSDDQLDGVIASCRAKTEPTGSGFITLVGMSINSQHTA